MATERSLTPDGKNVQPDSLEYIGDEKGISAEYSEYLRLDKHFSGAERKKLMRKVDFRVLLILTVSTPRLYRLLFTILTHSSPVGLPCRIRGSI